MDKHNVRISDRGHWIEDGHETLDLDSDSCEVCNIAYNEWCDTRDPTIMISLLTRTLDASKTSTP